MTDCALQFRKKLCYIRNEFTRSHSLSWSVICSWQIEILLMTLSELIICCNKVSYLFIRTYLKNIIFYPLTFLKSAIA